MLQTCSVCSFTFFKQLGMAALFSRNIVFQLVLMFLALTMSEAKTHVRITNDLPDNMKLNVHCKSKEDNLGVHVVSYLNSYEFSFIPNIWGTTQFYCSMAWLSHFHHFDIYIYYRDVRCQQTKHTCAWYVTPVGPCMLENLHDNKTICYVWNKD